MIISVIDFCIDIFKINNFFHSKLICKRKKMEKTKIALLNESECVKVLKNYLNLKDDAQISVINFELKPTANETLGFLGEYFLLNIIAKQDNSTEKNYEFFIKTLPVTNKGHREIIQAIGVFHKEAKLYSTLFKELKPYEVSKWHPDCYYTREDIIVMENLLNHNYGHLKERQTFPKKHIDIVLQGLASMHANSLILEENESISIGEKYKDYFHECSVEMKNGWFNAGIQGIKYVAGVHPKFQTASYQSFIKHKFIDKLNPIYHIVHTLQFRRVLCHRDIWNKNVLFKYSNKISVEPEACVFVDFQIGRYQPPAMDVMLFLHLTTDRAFRDSILANSLRYYYDCLRDNLAKHNISLTNLFSWDEFKKSCDYVKLPCIVLSGIYAPFIHLPANFLIDLKTNNPEKFNYFIDCDRICLIKDQMIKDQYFKEIMLEIVEELVEFVVDF